MKFSRMSRNHNKKRLSLLNVFARFRNIKKAANSSTPMSVPTSDNPTSKEENAEESVDAKINQGLQDKNPNVDFTKMEVASLRRALHFPTNFMTPSEQITEYAKMRVSAKQINLNNLCYFIGMIVAFLMTPFIATKLLHYSATDGWIVGALLALLIWFINYESVKTQYSRYRFKNQLRFQKFGTVLDLSELKRGYSINALLSETSSRFADKTLSNAIDTLNSRIQDKPESPMPYLAFAAEFSATQRARLFMLSVYRMAQGNYDDSQIKDIKHSASKDLTYQSTVLMHKKLARFNKLWFMQFTGLVILIIVYILLFIGIDIVSSLKGIM